MQVMGSLVPPPGVHVPYVHHGTLSVLRHPPLLFVDAGVIFCHKHPQLTPNKQLVW